MCAFGHRNLFEWAHGADEAMANMVRNLQGKRSDFHLQSSLLGHASCLGAHGAQSVIQSNGDSYV